MTDPVNEFFKRHYPTNLDPLKFEYTPMLGGMNNYRGEGVERVFPRMECTDGFTISVQGHAGAYSRPRDDFARHYDEVECGFPSEREDLLMPYAEDADRPTDTVYGYVPIEIVAQVIAKHGGLAVAPTRAEA